MADKFTDCINEQIKLGTVDKDKAAALIKDYEELVSNYRKIGKSSDKATSDAVEKVLADATLKKLEIERKTTLQASKLAEIKERFKNSPGNTNAKWKMLLQQAALNAENVEKVMISMLTPETKMALKPELFGLKRNHELMDKVVRSMLGQKTDDALAESIAKNLREVFDYTNTRLVAAGVEQRYLQNYFPQIHSVIAMKGAGKEAWVKFALKTYDHTKTISPVTNKNFANEKDFAEFLGHVWESKVNSRQMPGVENNIFGKHELARALHAKTTDHFIEYNKNFGTGEQGLFTTLQNYMHQTAKDIGVFENLGPMPLSTKRMMANDLGDKAFKKSLRLGEFNILTNNFTPGDNTNPFYKATSGTLNWLRTKLGGAGLASFMGDPVFTYAAAVGNGIEPIKAFKNHLSYIGTLGKAERIEAAKKGILILDNILRTTANDTRHAMNWLDSGGIAEASKRQTVQKMLDAYESSGRKASETIHKLSGLEALTYSTDSGMILAASSTIGDVVAKKGKFSDLNPKTREALEAFGFTQKEWDFIVKHQEGTLIELEADNIGFSPQLLLSKKFDSNDNFKIAQSAVNKIDAWYSLTGKLATNEPLLTTKALTTGAIFGERVGGPGTPLRAIMSTFGLFKSFGVSVMVNHVNSAFKNVTTSGSRVIGAKQLAALSAGGTVLGVGLTQLHQILMGKDLMQFDDKKLWMAGFLRSGGFGYYGDILFTDRSRSNRHFAVDVMGPTAGMINDALVIGGAGFSTVFGDAKEKKSAKLGHKLFKFGKNYAVPGVTSLFYTKLLADRYFLDHMERFSNPTYDKDVRMEERKRYKDYGQKYWWRKGEFSP